MALLASRKGRPRLCRACGSLVGADCDECTFCGAKDRLTTGLLRNPAMVFGRFGPAKGMMFIIAAYFGVMVLFDRLFHPGGPPINSTLGGVPYSVGTLFLMGGEFGSFVSQGQYWRLITSCFIHLGLMHLAFNSYALYQLGPSIEEFFGRLKFLVIYMAAGLAGSIACYMMKQDGDGASGAIFGLIGALIAYGVRLPTRFGQTVRAQAMQWAVYGLIMSFIPGISMTAHVGGLVGGFLVAYFLGPEALSRGREHRYVLAAAWIAMLLIVGSFLATGIYAVTNLPSLR